MKVLLTPFKPQWLLHIPPRAYILLAPTVEKSVRLVVFLYELLFTACRHGNYNVCKHFVRTFQLNHGFLDSTILPIHPLLCNLIHLCPSRGHACIVQRLLQMMQLKQASLTRRFQQVFTTASSRR